MAKGKKKETLTPEERLQAALVPESEQPYKLPENWCWTKGSAFLKPMETKRPEGEIFHYIDIDAIDNKKQQVTEPKILLVKDAPSRASRKLRTGDTIFSMVRPYLMNIAYIDETISNSIASTGFYVCTPAENVHSLYLYYLMISPYTVEGLNQYMKGDNSPSIRRDDVENYVYPIPPLTEQQRIVERIESLFAKLEEAKQKAQDALDSFETRKAAILHKAFTGELTAQWRKEHGETMESWEKTTLKNICKVNPKKIDTNGLPDNLEVSFFPMASLSEISGEITEPQTRFLKDVKTGFTNFSEGDVVFAKITPCMENGKSAIIGNLVNNIGYGTTEFYVLRCGEKLYNRYLYHIVRDITFRNKAKSVMAGAVGQQRVPKSFMEDYPLNLPSVSEQTEIVRILDDLLAKEQQAKEAAEGVLEQIDLIKKAILARAFRGELGTNDPKEESAVELLKQVLSC